jgi:hypothetical protein
MNPDLVDEDGLQRAVIDAARILGWLVAHFRPAMTKKGWRTPVSADGKGFPDLVLVHPIYKRLLFVELKGKRGKTTPEQRVWLEYLDVIAMATPVVEVHLWTPIDWPDRIMEVLSAKPR